MLLAVMVQQPNRPRARKTTKGEKNANRRVRVLQPSVKVAQLPVKVVQGTILHNRRETGNTNPAARVMPPAEESHNDQEARVRTRRRAVNALPARAVMAAIAGEAIVHPVMAAKVLPVGNGVKGVRVVKKEVKVAAAKAADRTDPAATARHAKKRAPLPTEMPAGLSVLF